MYMLPILFSLSFLIGLSVFLGFGLSSIKTEAGIGLDQTGDLACQKMRSTLIMTPTG